MDIKIGDKFEVYVKGFWSGEVPLLQIEIIGIYKSVKNSCLDIDDIKDSAIFLKNFDNKIQFIVKDRFGAYFICNLSEKQFKELLENTEDYKSNNRFPLKFDYNFQQIKD